MGFLKLLWLFSNVTGQELVQRTLKTQSSNGIDVVIDHEPTVVCSLRELELGVSTVLFGLETERVNKQQIIEQHTSLATFISSIVLPTKYYDSPLLMVEKHQSPSSPTLLGSFVLPVIFLVRASDIFETDLVSITPKHPHLIVVHRPLKPSKIDKRIEIRLKYASFHTQNTLDLVPIHRHSRDIIHHSVSRRLYLCLSMHVFQKVLDICLNVPHSLLLGLMFLSLFKQVVRKLPQFVKNIIFNILHFGKVFLDLIESLVVLFAHRNSYVTIRTIWQFLQHI